LQREGRFGNLQDAVTEGRTRTELALDSIGSVLAWLAIAGGIFGFVWALVYLLTA
jgi:hypothetical protein